MQKMTGNSIVFDTIFLFLGGGCCVMKIISP